MDYRFKVLLCNVPSRAELTERVLSNAGLVYHVIRLARPAFSSRASHGLRCTFYGQTEHREKHLSGRNRSHSSVDLQTEDWQPSLDWFYRELASKLSALRENEDSAEIRELKSNGFNVEYIDESSVCQMAFLLIFISVMLIWANHSQKNTTRISSLLTATRHLQNCSSLQRTSLLNW